MPLEDEVVFLPLLCPIFIRNNPVVGAKDPGCSDPTKPLHSVSPLAEPFARWRTEMNLPFPHAQS